MIIDSARLIVMFSSIADAISADKDRLCALDGVIGDADHGIAMELGFKAVRNALGAEDMTQAEPAMIFNTAAKSFLNVVGASSGPLYATAFIRAGAAVKGKQQLETSDFVAVFQAMSKGIQERGKAEPGEKTMVDAWQPAALAIGASLENGRNLADCIEAALAAAGAGAEATKKMVASKGRSARLGERSLGHMDPGAASAVTIIAAIKSAVLNAD